MNGLHGMPTERHSSRRYSYLLPLDSWYTLARFPDKKASGSVNLARCTVIIHGPPPSNTVIMWKVKSARCAHRTTQQQTHSQFRRLEAFFTTQSSHYLPYSQKMGTNANTKIHQYHDTNKTQIPTNMYENTLHAKWKAEIAIFSLLKFERSFILDIFQSSSYREGQKPFAFLGIVD